MRGCWNGAGGEFCCFVLTVAGERLWAGALQALLIERLLQAASWGDLVTARTCVRNHDLVRIRWGWRVGGFGDRGMAVNRRDRRLVPGQGGMTSRTRTRCA